MNKDCNMMLCRHTSPKIWLSSIVILLLLVCVCISAVADDNGENILVLDTSHKHAYACIPVATTIVLKYFGHPYRYEDVVKQMRVDLDGNTPASDLVNVCQSNSLYCNAFTGINLNELQKYLSNGRAAVLIGKLGDKNHASTLISKNGHILATDGLRPVHEVNMSTLDRLLQSGAICIVIGNQPMMTHKFSYLFIYVLISIILVTGLYVGCRIFKHGCVK